MSHHPTDVHVGAMIRARRKLMGVTQQRLADHLGVSFQQVQKYELGTNRVSASMLFAIAQRLECSTSLFFQGLGDIVDDEGRKPVVLTSEASEVARLLNRLPSPALRQNVVALVRAMAQAA